MQLITFNLPSQVPADRAVLTWSKLVVGYLTAVSKHELLSLPLLASIKTTTRVDRAAETNQIEQLGFTTFNPFVYAVHHVSTLI